MSLHNLREAFDRVFPKDTTKRKVLSILSVVLLFEGLSVIVLFSKVGLLLGLASILGGTVLLIFTFPRESVSVCKSDSPGIRLIDSVTRVVGGTEVLVVLGVAIIVLVFVYNATLSSNPDFGDSDTLSVVFGASLIAYHFTYRKFRLESGFVLMFLGLIVVFLVLPQILVSVRSTSGTSSVGDWYVHYMLAAPFAEILSFIGIPAESAGDMVEVGFRDGSTQHLSISVYCAGLYSFSIFLSAFFSFVLIFERLNRKMLAVVLALGLVVAYLGNLLRMVIIGIVGYYNGIDDMLWAHENVGWMIFLGWSAIFWWTIFNYASKHSARESDGGKDSGSSSSD